jgi:hypothetical protein
MRVVGRGALADEYGLKPTAQCPIIAALVAV